MKNKNCGTCLVGEMSIDPSHFTTVSGLAKNEGRQERVLEPHLVNVTLNSSIDRFALSGYKSLVIRRRSIRSFS